MSDTRCSYCGESMSTAGHSETVIEGGGLFDGMNVKSCPHVPHDRFWVMSLAAEPERMEARRTSEPPRYTLIAAETFPDLSSASKSTMTSKVKDWSAKMLKDYDKHAMKLSGPVPAPYSGLEAWLSAEEPDPQRVNWERMALGRPVGNAQDDMRRIGEENKRRGILKHGPYGCDVDCAKCKAEKRIACWGGQVPKPTLNEEYRRVELAMRYTAEQRLDGDQVYAPPRMSAADRAVASAEWSRQLREKVAEAKRRDAEQSRETHYWDPEGGEW